MDGGAPAVRIDALDMFVELLSQVEDDASSDAFYSRLCEATCALTSMERAVIFRYDEVRRRVRAAGAYGIPLDEFADAHVTVESAPVARQALEEDRVIEVTHDIADEVPEEFRELVRQSNLVCTPMGAAGRWFGVILSDRSARGAHAAVRLVVAEDHRAVHRGEPADRLAERRVEAVGRSVGLDAGEQLDERLERIDGDGGL